MQLSLGDETTLLPNPRTPRTRPAAATQDSPQDRELRAELWEAAFCHRGTRGQAARRRFYQHWEGSHSRHASARSAADAASSCTDMPDNNAKRLGRLAANTSVERMDAELAGDEKYRALFEKYGHRLRVPRPPPPKATPHAPRPRAVAATSDVGNRWAWSASAEARACSAFPTVSAFEVAGSVRPSVDGPALGTGPGAGDSSTAVAAADAECPRYASMASDVGGVPEGNCQGGLPALSAVASGDMPAALAAATAASSTAAAVIAISSAQPAPGGPSPASAAANAAAVAAAAISTNLAASGQAQMPRPVQSLMPKKELLRKRQQEILRKTEIVHYRSHMRKHFQRILDAVELTYSDSSGSKAKDVHRNLAKPILKKQRTIGGRREEE